jgi:hypothetical protein
MPGSIAYCETFSSVLNYQKMSRQLEFRKRAADLAETAAGQADNIDLMERHLRLAALWITMAENEHWLHHNSLSSLPRSSRAVVNRQSEGGAS